MNRLSSIPQTTRRQWLRRAAVSTSLLFGRISPLRAADDPAPKHSPIVDTHLHCFAGKDDARYPYHERGPYRPTNPATPEQLLKCMDGAGVDFAVVVHPEPYQDDHRYLEHCLDVGKGRLKGTCLFFAEQPASLDAMASLVKRRPGQIVAARIHAYAPERLPPFGRPELKALWKRAADLGLTLQLHFEPRYAAGFGPLIRDFPKTTVVIDHLGCPLQAAPEEHAEIVKWSRYPNTIMKISSLPDVTKYPHRQVAPIVRTLTDSFGADRLIYGGGFDEHATPQSYRAYRDRVAAFLTHLSSEDRAKVLGGNAARLFAFARQ